jgi:hypothetical protein
MKIPKQLLKAIAFVSQDQEDLDYRATAFVVSVPFDERTGCMHLVTAKHVATKLSEGKAMIALNGKDGFPLWMKNDTQVPRYFHEDSSVDVAILPMASARLNDYDYQDISTNMFVTEERQAQYDLGIGDDIFSLSLFRTYVGEERLSPIVRVGVIAMMPEGRFPHPHFVSVETYLIDCWSMGGYSGSPVFVRDTIKMQAQSADGQPRPFSAAGDFHLLGLLSGHITIPSTDGRPDQDTKVGLVFPARKILEALHSPHLSEIRAEAFTRGLLTDQGRND